MAERIPDLPEEEYHALSDWSSGNLRKVLKSWAHVGVETINPEAARIGRASHVRTLEPDAFHRRYVLSPKVDRRTKEGKALAQAVQEKAERDGLEVLDQSDFELVESIGQAVQQHPRARSLLSQSESEVTFRWSEQGLDFRARTDAIDDRQRVIVDLKTTRDSALDFSRAVQRYDLHIQAYHYLRGVKAVEGKDYDFVFIVVEKSAPFGVKLYRLSEEYLKLAEKRWFLAIDVIKERKEAPELYAGYSPEIVTLTPPKYLSQELHAF